MTISNPELVENLHANFRENTNKMTIKSDDYSIKILGVKWKPDPDPIQFYSKTGQKDIIYKTRSTVGSQPAL